MQQGHLIFEITVSVLALVALTANLMILSRISRSVMELMSTLDSFRRQLAPVIQDAHQISQDLRSGLLALMDRTQTGVEVVTAATEEIAHMAQDQVTEVRALLQDTVLAARNQVERLDGLLSQTAKRVDQTASIVQSEILEPVREFRCILVGVQRAFQVLLARKKSPVDQVYQDEELFI